MSSNDESQHAVLQSTMRKLRHELVECRRGGRIRSHHRMDIERLMEELEVELEGHEWAEPMSKRLGQLRKRVHVNGLTTTNCQDLEILLERLRRFERALNVPEDEEKWTD